MVSTIIDGVQYDSKVTVNIAHHNISHSYDPTQPDPLTLYYQQQVDKGKEVVVYVMELEYGIDDVSFVLLS